MFFAVLLQTMIISRVLVVNSVLAMLSGESRLTLFCGTTSAEFLFSSALAHADARSDGLVASVRAVSGKDGCWSL